MGIQHTKVKLNRQLEKEEVKKMSGVNPIQGANIGFSGISIGRSNTDSSHVYIASRINDLYMQALKHQPSTKSLKRFIDSGSTDGAKLHKIV